MVKSKKKIVRKILIHKLLIIKQERIGMDIKVTQIMSPLLKLLKNFNLVNSVLGIIYLSID
jgi:hypothetical protein